MCSCSNGKRVEGREGQKWVNKYRVWRGPCYQGLPLWKDPLSKGESKDLSLREGQNTVVWNGPVRLAITLECFSIAGVNFISQISFTVSSASPDASAAIRQPET